MPLALALVLVLLLPAGAAAQADDKGDDVSEPTPRFEEEIVVNAARSPTRIQDQPLRVEVIDREDIEEKALMTPGSVAMLIGETSGLRVQTTAPSPGAANVRIQGSRGRYSQMLADGLIDVPDSAADGGTLVFEFAQPVYLYEIEMIDIDAGQKTTLRGFHRDQLVQDNVVPDLDGNLADNRELFDALEEQAALERRITTLETHLALARIVDGDADDGAAGVGMRVRVRHLDTGETVEYELVGPIEANTRARPPAAFFEIATPAPLISASERPRPAASRAMRFARNVLVRMIRLPAST